MSVLNMPIFKVSKKFPFKTTLLKQYFMCFKIWKEAMPYKTVDITPEHKFRWNWRIVDSLNFIIFKWEFIHTFTSVQEEQEDFLSIEFQNSNQVNNFSAKILFKEKLKECLENTVILQVDSLTLKDPLLNSVRPIFFDIIKVDYKKFLDNVYNILQNEEMRIQILEDCYWTDSSAIDFS